MDDQRDPDVRDEASGPGARPWIAIAGSLLLHAALAASLTLSSTPESGGRPFAVDIEVAPQAPMAEVLPPEQLAAAQGDVVVPVPPAEQQAATPETPPDEALDRKDDQPDDRPDDDGEGEAHDAGVDAAPRKEPPDAAQAVAVETADAGVIEAPTATDAGLVVATTAGGVNDAGAVVPSQTFRQSAGDAGVAGAQTTIGPRGAVSAGTAANLLAYFPDKHLVTVLIRFDRLRGTEWAKVAQQVVGVMPDYETLVAHPAKTDLADTLDILAISTPRPDDVASTLVAVKSKITQAELRDFLDEPGAPVTWTRVTGGVLGKRGKGKRVFPKDPRQFLAPYARWMVLARPKDLPGLLEPAAGDLESATADPARLPTWLQRLPDIEAESGTDQGPALMMTLAPRGKQWNVPDVGLGVTEIPAPERLTLSLDIDPKGFVVRGNLRFRSEADAERFVELAENARDAALDSAAHTMVLKKARAFNAVKGLTLVRTDQRVTYATSISIADARVLMEAGASMLADFFASGGFEE